MDKISQVLKSRTFYTVVLMFAIGGFQNVTQFMPGDVATAVNGALAIAAVYFHVKPSQDYVNGGK